MTAYFGMIDICNPKPGETVVVSGAAGAVGMVAAQIAKIKGARVIGIAGGKDKCRWLKEELGLDVVIDYKGENVKEALEKATPKYIDAYFDNGIATSLRGLTKSRREHIR
jgi:NADPH-dependent curcumin reductase CurA